VGERIRSVKPWSGRSASPAHDVNLPSVYADRRMARMPKLPVCFDDDTFVRDFLAKRFPAIEPDPMCHCDRCEHLLKDYEIDWSCPCRPCRNIRNRAAWLLVIVEFYRMGEPAPKLEEAHHWAPGTVGHIAQKIRRAAAGERLDGRKRTGKPRGRPRSLSGITPFVEPTALIKS
jgi:hypothetical protein